MKNRVGVETPAPHSRPSPAYLSPTTNSFIIRKPRRLLLLYVILSLDILFLDHLFCCVYLHEPKNNIFFFHQPQNIILCLVEMNKLHDGWIIIFQKDYDVTIISLSFMFEFSSSSPRAFN